MALQRVLILSLFSLICAVVFGVLASHTYFSTDPLRPFLSFEKLRPLHVTAALTWILSASSTLVLINSDEKKKKTTAPFIGKSLFILWLVYLIASMYYLLIGEYGGREYWEFPPITVIPLFIIWIITLIVFIRSQTEDIRNWPVYRWMWLCGIIFFLLSLSENFLWLIPAFRSDPLTDLTIQWKAAGSMVGAWNQLVYGGAMWLMDKISGNTGGSRSKTAYTLWFIGLSNLLFNWSHHIYTLPTEPYIRHIGYIVSMSEWILLIRIIYFWKKSLNSYNSKSISVQLLKQADQWVLINLTLAIFMSVPALNLYTHGTYVTIAHAMGTTIGINTMLLLALLFYYKNTNNTVKNPLRVSLMARVAHYALIIFFLSLVYSGILKGIENNTLEPLSTSAFTERLKPVFILFSASGTILAVSLIFIAVSLIKTIGKNN